MSASYGHRRFFISDQLLQPGNSSRSLWHPAPEHDITPPLPASAQRPGEASALRSKSYPESTMEVGIEHYLSPLELRKTPAGIRKILLVGSCQLEGWPPAIKSVNPNCQCEFYLANNVPQLPPKPQCSPEEYNFQ